MAVVHRRTSVVRAATRASFEVEIDIDLAPGSLSCAARSAALVVATGDDATRRHARWGGRRHSRLAPGRTLGAGRSARRNRVQAVARLIVEHDQSHFDRLV